MALIERLGRSMEIVSVDAMQVYCDMNIGTAKPTVDERARVRHHLIDLVDPSDDFTVARFQSEYRGVRADLDERSVTPVLVGGTGLYVRAVVDALEIPGQWPAVRERLEVELDRVGSSELHARLRSLDPSAAAKIEPNNARRVVRALEVTEGSGRPFSSFGPGVDTYPSTDVVQIALRWSREASAQRIAQRVQSMMASGWLDEVDRLAERTLSRTAARALGYHELFEHRAGRLTLDEAVDTIVLRTRQFAVRQERWFRRDPRILWIDMNDDAEASDVAMSDVIDRILTVWAPDV